MNDVISSHQPTVTYLRKRSVCVRFRTPVCDVAQIRYDVYGKKHLIFLFLLWFPPDDGYMVLISSTRRRVGLTRLCSYFVFFLLKINSEWVKNIKLPPLIAVSCLQQPAADEVRFYDCTVALVLETKNMYTKLKMSNGDHSGQNTIFMPSSAV